MVLRLCKLDAPPPSQGTPEKPGLVPQALEHIFRQLPTLGGGSAGGGARIVVSAYEVRWGAVGGL